MVRDAAGPPAGPSPNEHPDGVGERAVGAAEADQPSVASGSPQPSEATESPQPSEATEVPQPSEATESPQPSVAAESPQPAKHRKQRRLLYLTLPGCWGALIFGCLSFTPSLLPRGGVIQGIV